MCRCACVCVCVCVCACVCVCVGMCVCVDSHRHYREGVLLYSPACLQLKPPIWHPSCVSLGTCLQWTSPYSVAPSGTTAHCTGSRYVCMCVCVSMYSSVCACVRQYPSLNMLLLCGSIYCEAECTECIISNEYEGVAVSMI